MANKIILIVALILILIILVIFAVLIYSRDKNYSTDPIFNSCDTIMNKKVHCESMKANIGNCNNMIKKFFEDEGIKYLKNYSDDPDSAQPGILVAEYDYIKGKVVPVIPPEIYSKILNSKLSNKNDKNLGISVFVAQTPIFSNKIADVLQIYHTALVFVETSKYNEETGVFPEDILFCLELLVQTVPINPLGLATCLYPKIKDGKVDISYQSLSKIVIEYPEAFGCKADGGYWDKRYKFITHVGNTTKSVIEGLYGESIKWFQNNWAYVATTLVSQPCYGNIVPENSLFGITCGTFVQAMCALLVHNYPENFSGLFEKVAWNDTELIGEWEKVDLTSKKNVIDINIYIDTIDKVLKSIADNNKTTLSNYDKENTAASKYILNSIVGSIIFPKVIKFILKTENPYMYVTGFEDNTYNVYKITLSPPYLQSVFDICPGLMYKLTL
jgi:hypothetical protein